MEMTNEEICRHYTQAADKRKDISILADLNITNEAAIRAVLKKGAVLEEKPDKRQGSGKKGGRFDKKIEPLLSEGFSSRDIAARVGCSVQTVYNFQNKMKKQADSTGGTL